MNDPTAPTEAVRPGCERPAHGSLRARRRAIAASAVGTALEWFDFSVYAALATVIGQQFFDVGDPVHSFLAAVAVFGVGFLFRPLGAVFFGHIGDTRGRKPALALTIVVMGASTTLLALAPTSATAGILGPVILVVARIGQGFSAGGEFAGGAAFIIEYAPRRRRGYFGSIHYMALIFGNLVGAALVAVLFRTLSVEQMGQFGWRIPFATGLLVALLGLWMRLKLADTPEFSEARRAEPKPGNPLVVVARTQRIRILQGVGLVAGFTIATYTYVNMQGFIVTYGDLDSTDVSLIYSLSLVVQIPLIGVFGALSDRVGRRPVLLAGIIAIALSAFPTLALVSTGNAWFGLLGLTLMAVAIAVYAGPFTAAITEMMPVATRYSALSIAYGLAVAVFGGTAGFVVAYLRDVTGSALAPALFCIAACLVTLGTVLRIGEPSLQGAGQGQEEE
ncbi:MFS transporter [Streptomyces sp. NPDC052042]|uniref:MFS transporter n=1 Tax=Streptomyces sp. NPDC052042 TaxID=3365683 RepID=UPI0037D22379